MQEAPHTYPTLCLQTQLKEHLKRRAMTAAELSRRSGVPKQVLSLWLAGVEPRKLSHLKKVAIVLGTTIDGLCFGEHPAATANEAQALHQETWFEGVFEGRIRKVLVPRGGRD